MRIDNMPAGKEIDALIAEKIMGWHLIPEEDDETGMHWAQMWLNKDNKFMHNEFKPSIDLTTAWEVVKEMQGRGFWFYCGSLSSYCYASFEEVKTRETYSSRVMIGEIPLAICHAALLAILENS